MDVTVDMMESEGITAEIHSPGAPQVIAFQGGDKLINMPRAAYASQLGFRSGSGHTADNTTAFKRFLRNKNIYTLVLDADYIIATTQTEPAHDILIIGNGHRLIIDDVSGGYGLIKANNYGLFFENVVFTVGSAFATMNDNKKNYKANVVYAAKGYTQTLGEISFDGCSFIAANGFNPGAVWANPSPPEFTLDTVNHGFSAVRLTGCSIVNNTNIIVTIYDMPGTVEVTGCNIKNMRARIVTVGMRSPNDSNFVARAQALGLAAEEIKAFNQSIRRQISLYVHDNSVKNDIIISDTSAQYICFVWMKGGKAVATGNRIEDIAVSLTRNALNKPTEVFPMYLLAEDVIFSGNVCKNVYNFAYDPTAATGSEDKLYYTHSILPNVKMYQGEKIISNNTFVLEEAFLSTKCTELNKSITDLWPVVFIEMYDDGDNLNINNNVFNTYFLQFSRMDKRRYDGVVRISNNTFTIGTLGKADGTENKRNDLILTYGGNYIISDNYFQIGSIETELNFLTGETPPSGVENTFVTQLTVKGNCFDIGQLLGSFNIIYAPNNGEAVINDNEIIIDDYRQVFRLLYGNNIPATIKNNHIDIKNYTLTSQIGGILQESANIKGSDLSISYEAEGSLPQSAGNIVLGSRKLSFAAKFFSPAYSTNLLQLFIENRALTHPADKTYTYFIRLRAYRLGVDELIKLTFLPYRTASYKLRYRAASGYVDKTAAELYSEAIDTQLYSEGGEAVPLRVVGSANSNVKIKQVTDKVAADWYDISIVTVVSCTETLTRSYSGTAPLSFPITDGEVSNYRIYGNTVDGESVGDKTGNLFDGFIQGIRLNTSTGLEEKNNTSYTSGFIGVENDKLYSYSGGSDTTPIVLFAYDSSKNYIGRSTNTARADTIIYTSTTFSNYTSFSTNLTGNTNPIAYIRITHVNAEQTVIDDEQIMLNSGSEPLPYEPYGYRVPVTVTNGTNTETTNIYLPEQIKMVGDEAEYIDYAEQKQHRVRKNLLPNTATSQTINGVTFTVNEDGRVTCNGTASAITYFNLNENFNSTLYAGAKASFYQSGQQPDVNTYIIQISKANRVGLQDLQMNNQVIIDNGDSLLLAIRINSGYTCDNLTFYPMLRKADITDDTYEPYIENTDIDVTLPALSTIKGTNTLSVGTEVQPSSVAVDVDEIVSCGDKITDNRSVDYGKYKIPVTLTAGSAETTDIYLDEPLAKSGNNADYTDYATQKRHNSDGTSIDVTLPAPPTLSGTNTLTVGTEVQPSGVEIKGRIKAAGGD